MKNKNNYSAPEAELILVRFEENILSGVDTQNTTVSNLWEGADEQEL